MEMESRLSGQDISYDPVGSADDDEDGGWAPAAYLAGPEKTDPAQVLEQSDSERQSNDQLHAALHDLDERARIIVQQRWLSDQKATLQELAERFGVSAERVRQIESNAMKKLKRLMA
jgi:RNA polymerase sigma-32 factor